MRQGARAVCLAALALQMGWTLAQEPEPSENERSRRRWNQVFERAREYDWQPNSFLAEVTRDLAPGEAVDIGMGQGRNALYLAEKGWRVTGIDISDEAIRQALQAAEERGLKLDAQTADALEYEYGTERWDLVVGMYMHGLITSQAEKIVRSIKPGGLLIVEGFHKDLNRRGVEGGYIGYKTNELLRAFDGLRVLYYEEIKDVGDWGRGQVTPLVRFIARKEPR